MGEMDVPPPPINMETPARSKSEDGPPMEILARASIPRELSDSEPKAVDKVPTRSTTPSVNAPMPSILDSISSAMAPVQFEPMIESPILEQALIEQREKEQKKEEKVQPTGTLAILNNDTMIWKRRPFAFAQEDLVVFSTYGV
jgi:hypothetical protein